MSCSSCSRAAKADHAPGVAIDESEAGNDGARYLEHLELAELRAAVPDLPAEVQHSPARSSTIHP